MTGLMERARNQSRRRKGMLAQSTPDLHLGSDVRRQIAEEPIDNGINGHTSSPPQAYKFQDEQILRLIQTQEETARALFKLNSAQGEIVRTLSEFNDAILNIPSAMYKQKAEDNDDASIDGDDLGLDRKQVRLDGLEVYAVVSAVTAGTMVAVFDSYHPGDITELFYQGRYLEVLTSLIFLGTGTVGIVCGLHCIFVFSLITMYGRTALGMDRDDALEDFFGATGLQRYHGFQTFVGSLYSLMIQLIIVIASKVSVNPLFLLVILGVTGRMMFFVYADTQIIMDKAQVIFQHPVVEATKHARNTMRSAESILKSDYDLNDNDDTSEDSTSKDKNFRHNSIQKARGQKSYMTMSACSYAINDKTNKSMEETDRPTRHRSEGDIGDGSEKFTKASNSSIRWSAGDVSLNNDGDEYGQDQTGKGHFIARNFSGMIKRAKPTKPDRKMERRKSRSSLSQPAIQQMIGEIDEEVEDEPATKPKFERKIEKRKSRSSLSQPAIQQMIGVIDEEVEDEPLTQPRRRTKRSTLDLTIDMMDIVPEDDDDQS